MRYRLLLPLLLILATPLAHAGYIGASFVSTNAELEDAVDAIGFDTDDDGWKLFAGFQLYKTLDIEASYRELGSFFEVVGSSTLDAEIEVIDIGAVLRIPIGRKFELFARGGYADIDVDGGITGGTADQLFDGDWELTYGVGASWRFSKLAIRAEWEQFDIADALNSFSAGVVIDF